MLISPAMKRLASLLVVASFLIAAPAAAQQERPAVSERALEAPPEEDKTSWSLIGGFVMNTGNTQAWTINAGTTLVVIRGQHGFAAESAFNASQANLRDAETGERTGFQSNARNLNSRLRYDYFFTPLDAAFYTVRHRWDPFAGLDSRVQNQIGYLRNFYRKDDNRVWGESGYDLTYDNFHPTPLIDPDTMLVLPGWEIVHAARVFLGYNQQVNEHVLVQTGAEVLFNLQQAADIRFNYDARLVATLTTKLKVELKFRLQFDNVPVPNAQPLDTLTMANLIVTLY